MPYSPANMMETDEAMQRYQLLSSQQEVIRRRLSLSVPSPTPMTPASPEFQSISHSLSSSPSSSRYWTSPSPRSSFSSMATSTYPIPVNHSNVPHRRSMSVGEEETQKLSEINQQIKATLTELLNTDSVRHDDKYRTWIQGRLMDAEHEIRRQRRHRSVGDKEMAERIGEHLEP